MPGSNAHLAALRGEGVQGEHGFFALREIRALVRGKIVQEGRGQDVRGVEAVEDGLHCSRIFLAISAASRSCIFFMLDSAADCCE